MTAQEAIEILRDTPIDIRSTREDDIHTLYATAQNMAIEALRFVDEYHQNNIKTYAHDMGVSLEQAEHELSCSEKPNESDLISRQDAIDAVKGEIEINGYSHIVDVLRQLPSAQRTGEWIAEEEYGDLWVCDQCGFASEHNDNYCPNCGAKMRGDNNV